MKRSFGKDVWGSETFYESDGSTARITRVQDVTPIIEDNKKRAQDSSHSTAGIKKGWWHMAHIPNVVLEMWKSQGLIKDVFFTQPEDLKRVERLLEDPQWRYLKTTPHRIYIPRKKKVVHD